MKFGVREICDVVLRAKANQKVGNKIFYKNEPVIYFDTLKTSSMEGAATTVYAQGGKGNSRLMAWEGERTVTFTMEDALISPAGFMILSGAGLVEASTEKKVIVHTTEQTNKVKAATGGSVEILVTQKPYVKDNEQTIYVMVLDGNGEVYTEPYIGTCNGTKDEDGYYKVVIAADKINAAKGEGKDKTSAIADESVVLVDYYVERTSNVSEITITPDKFGGNYYLEASTLFRNTDGVDMPAEFIIPNCKIQSNFTFTMASSGDPSSFTFTIDAFPDYTRFDPTKKVLAVIQIITGAETEGTEDEEAERKITKSNDTADVNGMIIPATPSGE